VASVAQAGLKLSQKLYFHRQGAKNAKTSFAYSVGIGFLCVLGDFAVA
jgi:hypothetical protein